MKKISVIQGKRSDWISCRTIVSNLLKTYDSLNEEYEVSIVEPDLYLDSDFYEVYKKLKQNEPDIISIMTHCPVPFKLFLYLSQDPSFKDKKIVVHIFGDFMEFFSQWADTLNLLKGMDVRLLCASDAQYEVVKPLMASEDSVGLVPFSVDHDDFFFSDELREKSRRELNLNDNEFSILYTGRISCQKNVVPLISCFNYLKENFIPNAKLYIAGVCDDIGIRYLNKEMLNLFYPYQCYEKINNNDSIKFLGVLSKSELNSYYNACDIFCSLSVHNDEDFGMSPAEALAVGMDCVLTRWGGYKSFNLQNTDYIPVKITETSIDIDQKQVVKTLFKKFSDKTLTTNRAQKSKSFFDRFGHKATGELLFNELKHCIPFAGISEQAMGYKYKSSKKKLFFNSSDGGAYSKEYLEIYKGKYD